MLPRMRPLLACLLVIAAMTACLGGTEPPPLGISVEAPASANTTDSVSIVVNAQGNSLIGVETAFGDGNTGAFATNGARTARLTFRHLYTQSGTYDVTATVTDAVLGEKAATVQLNVQ
jgi:hypothetical protein